MRDIIFRGLTKEKKWVEGSLVTGIFQKSKTNEDVPYILNIENAEYYSFEDLDEYNGYHEVLPETIGQYTGLCDRNGKRIFEGDIVENSDDLYIVEWTEDNARFSLCDKASYVDADFDNFWGHELEVVGNIHENKELLEVIK